MPESVFLFTDTLLVFDHLQHKIKVVSHFRLDGDVEAAYRQAAWRIEELVGRLEKPLAQLPYRAAQGVPADEVVSSNMTREDHALAVERAKQHIVAGDIIQVVLSQRFQRPTAAHPFDVYRALRTINPSPYMFYLDLGEAQLVGTSPEMLVRVEDGKIDYHPIAGTRPRGGDAGARQGAGGGADRRREGDRGARHAARPGPQRRRAGQRAGFGRGAADHGHRALLACHAPRVARDGQAAQRPDVRTRRCGPASRQGRSQARRRSGRWRSSPSWSTTSAGPYAGCVGYFDLSGNLDTAITIRTILMKDGVAHVQAGGGIVYDSDAATEYAETENKARALIRAIELAEEQSAGRPAGSLGY